MSRQKPNSSNSILQQFKNRRKNNNTPLVKISRNEPMPVSFLQESYFVRSLSRNNGSNNPIMLTQIEGCKNESLLCELINDFIKRHEIFRVYFRLQNERVYQFVVPEDKFNFSIEVINLSGLDAPTQKLEMKKMVQELGYQPFDLEVGPLFRAKLFKLGADQFCLFRCFHHIIFDLGTDNIFYNDIISSYEARVNGSLDEQANPEFHFADYASWERENLTDETLKSQFDHWKTELTNAPDMIVWPIDFVDAKPKFQNFKLETTSISNEIWGKLKNLAKENNLSDFQVNLAIFAIFLHRYTAETDICIGSTIDLRRSLVLPNLLGPLINEFLVRCTFKQEMICSEFFKTIGVKTISAFLNSAISYDKMILASNFKRESTTFLFFPNRPFLSSQSIQFKEIFKDAGGGEWDIVVQLIEQEASANISIRYNADLFSPLTIQNMLGSYLKILQFIIDNPNAKLDELPNLEPIKGTVVHMAKSKRVNGFVIKDRDDPGSLDQVETVVANIWSMTLDVSISRHDNFFDVGGSLSKMSLVNHLLRENGIYLDFKDLLRYPTIASIGEHIRSHGNAKVKKAAGF